MKDSITRRQAISSICLLPMVGLTACTLPGMAEDLAGTIAEAIDGPIEIERYTLEEDSRFAIEGVGFDIGRVKAMKISAYQEQMQWCWAACIQMAFRFQGYEVSQERLVRATYGQTVNLPASGTQMHRMVDRDWTDDNGRRFLSSSRVLVDWSRGRRGSSATGNRVHEELSEGRPLLLGYNGHAMLLVAQEAIIRRSSGRVVEVKRAMVVDPWPLRIDTDQLKVFYTRQISMTNFLASVSVSSA